MYHISKFSERVVVFENRDCVQRSFVEKNATLPGIVAPKDRIAPLRIAWRCGAYFVGGMIGDPKYFILDM